MGTVLVALTLGACEDLLTVENLNTPDRERALSDPDDLEAVVGSSFHAWWNHLHTGHPKIGLSAAADELTSSRPRWLMRMFGSQPRYEGGDGFPNEPSFAGRGHNERPWYGLYGAVSLANDGLRAIDQGVEFGSDGEDTPRAEAFARFVQALSHGMVALLYDRGFVVTEDIDLQADEVELRPYGDLMDAALAQFDQAIEVAVNNSFQLPENWVNGLALTNDQLARVARSYKARYMAAVARTPEGRAAVDWEEVIRLVDQGIQEDFAPMGDGASWTDAAKRLGSRPFFARVDYLVIGPADTSGAYQEWRSKPVQERQPIALETADRRITGVDGPESPGTDMDYHPAIPMPGAFGPYFFSHYHFHRYDNVNQANGVAPLPVLTTQEMDLLKAEALLRLDRPGEAVDLINTTRVGRGELEPATTGDPVGSWEDPQDPAPEASLWSKLKHEKRIETYYTGVGLAYFDDRGWGDLVCGTHLQNPIPGKELLNLQMDIYTFGGEHEWTATEATGCVG